MANSALTSEIEKESMEQPPAVVDSDDHLDRLLLGTDIEEPWFKSIIRGIRETLNPPKLPPLEITSKPLESADLGDLSKIELPWYSSLFNNIRELIHPPKLPPLAAMMSETMFGSRWMDLTRPSILIQSVS